MSYLCPKIPVVMKSMNWFRMTALLVVNMMFVGLCAAQEELPSLVPDRPGYTWGADVLPFQKVALDNGFGFEATGDGSHTTTLSSTIVRYGIFENMELRVGTDFLLCNDGTDPVFAVAPLTLGTKIKVYESESWLPSVAVLAQVQSSHIGSSDQLPSHLAPSMYACFEHSIADRYWVCYNAGLEWNGEDAVSTTFLALSFGLDIIDGFGAYLESYNYLNAVDGNQYMGEIGLTWSVSRRLQLDLECDFNMEHFGTGYAIGGGVAWMIN